MEDDDMVDGGLRLAVVMNKSSRYVRVDFVHLFTINKRGVTPIYGPDETYPPAETIHLNRRSISGRLFWSNHSQTYLNER
jgi:hypothetical protein